MKKFHLSPRFPAVCAVAAAVHLIHPFPVRHNLIDSRLIGTLDIHNPPGKGLYPGKHFIGIEKEAAVKIFIFPYPQHLAAPSLPVQAVEDIRLLFFIYRKLDAYLLKSAAAASERYAPAMRKIASQLKGKLFIERTLLKKRYAGDTVQPECGKSSAFFLVQAQIPPSGPGAHQNFQGNPFHNRELSAAAAFIFQADSAFVADSFQAVRKDTILQRMDDKMVLALKKLILYAAPIQNGASHKPKRRRFLEKFYRSKNTPHNHRNLNGCPDQRV